MGVIWVEEGPPVYVESAAGKRKKKDAASNQGVIRFGLMAVRGVGEKAVEAVIDERKSHGDFASRMAQFGIHGKAAENLSLGLGSVEQVIAQWQGSSGHNANMLNPGFTAIGIGLRVGMGIALLAAAALALVATQWALRQPLAIGEVAEPATLQVQRENLVLKGWAVDPGGVSAILKSRQATSRSPGTTGVT